MSGTMRAAADVDEDARRGQLLVADADGRRRLRSAPCPWKTVQPCHAAQPTLDAVARVGDDRVGARLDLRHVDARRAVEHDAVVGRASREVRGVGAGDQRLGRHAAGVDAGAAEQLALDERDRHARAQSAGRPAAGRPGRRR